MVHRIKFLAALVLYAGLDAIVYHVLATLLHWK
jgi:hypothetical protein